MWFLPWRRRKPSVDAMTAHIADAIALAQPLPTRTPDPIGHALDWVDENAAFAAIMQGVGPLQCPACPGVMRPGISHYCGRAVVR